jgi:hypothetical protein
VLLHLIEDGYLLYKEKASIRDCAFWLLLNLPSIGRDRQEVERHQRLEGGAITAFGPCPVEVADGFEAADMGVLETAFQASVRPLLLFPDIVTGDSGMGLSHGTIVGLTTSDQNFRQIQRVGFALRSHARKATRRRSE